LDSYRAVATTAASIPSVARHLDTLVGTVLGGHRFDIDQVSGTVLPSVVLDEGGGLRVEDRFALRWPQLEHFLNSDEIQFTVLYPVAGLIADDAPIELESGLVLDRLSDHELDDVDQQPFVEREARPTWANVVQRPEPDPLVRERNWALSASMSVTRRHAFSAFEGIG
jgi:hypothetical protein